MAIFKKRPNFETLFATRSEL